MSFLRKEAGSGINEVLITIVNSAAGFEKVDCVLGFYCTLTEVYRSLHERFLSKFVGRREKTVKSRGWILTCESAPEIDPRSERYNLLNRLLDLQCRWVTIGADHGPTPSQIRYFYQMLEKI